MKHFVNNDKKLLHTVRKEAMGSVEQNLPHIGYLM